MFILSLVIGKNYTCHKNATCPRPLGSKRENAIVFILILKYNRVKIIVILITLFCQKVRTCPIGVVYG